MDTVYRGKGRKSHLIIKMTFFIVYDILATIKETGRGNDDEYYVLYRTGANGARCDAGGY